MISRLRLSRVLSGLVILALLIGVLPMGALGADYEAPDEEIVESYLDVGAREPKIDAYDLSDSMLTSIRKNIDGPVTASNMRNYGDKGYTEEELAYVDEYAEMLTEPVGIVDVEGSADSVQFAFVWLQSLPDALEDAYRQHHGVGHNRAYENAREQGHRARNSIRNRHSREIVYEYNVVFSGFAIEATMSELETIAAMDGVFAVTEVGYEHYNYIPDPEYTTIGNAVAREIMGIADLHAAGIDGSGMKVGVIDSGIQADHPDLAGAFAGGYNFAPRGALNPGGRSPDMSTPDGDHGTHVSGIIASQGINSLGVAPGVELYVAQVFTPDNTNSASQADITAAIEAFCGGNPNPGTYPNIGLPPVDVINLSLGNDYNSAYEEGHVVRNNAVIAGVVVVCSAGNNAYPQNNTTDRRNYSLGSGGVSLPISVAASQYGGNRIFSYVPTVSNDAGAEGTLDFFCENGDAALSGVFRDGAFGSEETRYVTYGPMNPPDTVYPHPVQTYTIEPLVYIEGKGYELYYACAGNIPSAPGTYDSDMTDEEMAELNSLEDGSLSGKILVVNRGQAFYEYKCQALRLGAAGLIVINRADSVIGNLNIGSETSAKDLLIFSAPSYFKQTLYDLVQGDEAAYLDPGPLEMLAHVAEPADFSSIGPVRETAEIKPDIIAPGYSILSTVLDSGYQEMGGTSMSSPWIAGVAALVKQAYPEASTTEIKARIMNTADPDLIKPLSGRPYGNPSYYFDIDGTETSVFEQGAGFVNPKRAVSEAPYITVANYGVPTGDKSMSTFDVADMASFSFGVADAGAATDRLTATVHNASGFSLDVRYNQDTRYSNKNLYEDVVVMYEIDGDTFDVWLEIAEWANDDLLYGGNLYEGYIIVTADGNDYVLPWAVRIGEATGIEFDPLATAERPIISTSTNTAIRSAGGTAPRNSNSTTLWFSWDGEWPVSAYYGVRALELCLIDPVTFDVPYIYDPVGPLPEESGGGLYRVANYISRTAYNMYTGRSVTVANGAYILGIWMDFDDGTYDIYGYLDLGVVFTNGLGDMAVVLTIDQMTDDGYFIVDTDPAVNTVDITGRIYSPALALAEEAGFLWTEVDDFWEYDEYYYIDQSLNVIGYATTADIYISGTTAYNLLLAGGSPWICDEDGYFWLTTSITQAAKNGGYPFGNNSIVGVEGFYYNDNGSSWPLIGANKSAALRPQYAVDVPELVEVTLSNGVLTAEFAMSFGSIPEAIDEDALTAVLLLDGVEVDVLVFEGYDADTGLATWTFEPIRVQLFTPLELEATVTYVNFKGEVSLTDTAETIYLVAVAASASVEKLSGNQNKLTIKVNETYSDGSKGVVSETTSISNNSSGTYNVDPYKVYVDTKGNDQIRACDIVALP